MNELNSNQNTMQEAKSKKHILLYLIIALLIGVAAWLGYQNYQLEASLFSISGSSRNIASPSDIAIPSDEISPDLGGEIDQLGRKRTPVPAMGGEIGREKTPSDIAVPSNEISPTSPLNNEIDLMKDHVFDALSIYFDEREATSADLNLYDLDGDSGITMDDIELMWSTRAK